MFIFIPKFQSETNSLPSMFTKHTDEGVNTRLSVDESKPPTYNGLTIEDMRSNVIFDKLDQIDRIGKVRAKLAENIESYRRSDFNRTFMHALQSSKKPKSN